MGLETDVYGQNYDYFIVDYNVSKNNHDQIWNRTYGEEFRNNKGHSILYYHETQSLFIVGETEIYRNNTYNTDAFITCYNISSGNLVEQWNQAFEGEYEDIGLSLEYDRNHNYIMMLLCLICS